MDGGDPRGRSEGPWRRSKARVVDAGEEPLDVGAGQRRRIRPAARAGGENRRQRGDRTDAVTHRLIGDPADGDRRPRLGDLAQPLLADRGEVQPSAATEQAQVPDVAAAFAVLVAVGEANAVDAEAGEPHVPGVGDAVERAEVELGHRPDAKAAQLVDPRPHSTGDHADLLGGPAADRIDQFQSQQVG